MATNLRRNPIDSTISAVTITDEAHTIAEFDELPGVYGFILDERPVAGTVSVREDTTAETPYTIVTTNPLPGQVFVDFNENRGYCIFNIADNGGAVITTYDGAGSNLTAGAVETIATTQAAAAITAQKDATGGIAGLTLFKINFRNVANTFTSFFTNSNTAARTYTFQNRDGTIADDTDLAGKQATLVSGTNIKTVNSTSLLGSGDVSITADVAGAIVAAAAKSTPIDADSIGIVDSAAANALKETTFAELKTVFKVTRAEWMADTHAGNGGTDTKIPYFTNVNINVDTGGAMTVVNNSTNGCKITINTAGVYAVGFWFSGSSDGDQIGISVNASSASTNIASITASGRRAFSQASGSGRAEFLGFTGYLAANDIIRPHTEGQASGVAGLCGFSICRVV